MNRFDRLAATLVQLQARRVVRGSALAEQFGVSLRTVYRDLRTLEAAGIPLCGEAGVGFSLADGYRLPPVMFTREEAIALLTAEKLAARLTDGHTAKLSHLAMDKLRAVLRRVDRDYLADLDARLEVRPWLPRPAAPAASTGDDAHHRLLSAAAETRVVRLSYRAGYTGTVTERDVEPIGLYFGLHWHMIAFCRLRQAFRDFRLDRITSLRVLADTFYPRPETLQRYWQELAGRRPQHTATVQFWPEALPYVQEAKHYYGWAHEQPPTATGVVEMTFLPGALRHLAHWLLVFAGQVAVVGPPELRQHLRELAHAAYQHFGETETPPETPAAGLL